MRRGTDARKTIPLLEWTGLPLNALAYLSRRSTPTASEWRTKALKKTRRASAKPRQRSSKVDPPVSTNDLQAANKTASFVAHELNNLLTVIQINTEFLLESTGGDPTSAQELDEIQLASRRACILARQLLASSRLEPFDPGIAEAALKKRSTVGERSAASAAKGPRVAETILLVEDEAAVRTLTKRILSQKSYRVLEASDGAIALRLAAGHVGEIDLVLTDVAMPNLGGRGMVEELRELSPGVRVLFMSGYPKEEVFPDKSTANRTPYLQKPFTGETLLSEVRAALGYAP
jgi:CheY-like chemotaxis protein